MNQEECIRKLQSRLAQSESQLTASLATVAQLREALESARKSLRIGGNDAHWAQATALSKRLHDAADRIPALTTPAPAVVQVAKVLPIDADYLEEQIAFELDAAVTSGRLSVNKLVTENRAALRQLIDSSIKRALTPATKG